MRAFLYQYTYKTMDAAGISIKSDGTSQGTKITVGGVPLAATRFVLDPITIDDAPLTATITAYVEDLEINDLSAIINPINDH